jgi:cytochrome P450
MCTERCVLRPDKNGPAYEIAPGTMLIVNAWAIANDPATWKDPAAFRPERFLPPDHTTNARSDRSSDNRQIADRSSDRQNADHSSSSSSSNDSITDPTPADCIDVFGHSFELLPFGSGRRICPGIGLALSIVELAVANLAHCFDWSPAAAGPVDMSEKFGLSLPRASPLLVVPTRFRLSSAAALKPSTETVDSDIDFASSA